MESDGGWPIVAGAGWFAGFLDSITVVAGAFDRAGTGSFPAGRDEQARDIGQPVWQGLIPVPRGECPPSR